MVGDGSVNCCLVYVFQFCEKACQLVGDKQYVPVVFAVGSFHDAAASYTIVVQHITYNRYLLGMKACHGGEEVVFVIDARIK